jgi:threonine dehydrogenase-like Zn-dependent dehydrogenase
MRQLEYVGPKRLEWREVPDLEIRSKVEALVHPLAAATCDLDRHIAHGLSPFPPPFPIGHEFVGRVLAVGESVRTVSPEAYVAVAFQVSCGACRFCVRGLTANCNSMPRESMYGIGTAGGGFGGAFSDCVRVPFADAMLVKLPNDLPAATAASLPDNVADGWRAVVPPLTTNPGADVLILNGGGPGSVGLYAALAAKAAGAGSVHLYDTDERRLEIARKAGADAHLVETWPQRVDAFPITVDNSNAPDGLACAIRSTEAGGVCTVTSMYLNRDLPVPITEMYMKGMTVVTGRVHSRAVLPEVLAMVAAGRLDPALVTTEVAPFEDAAEAVLGYSTKLVLVRSA